MEYITNTFFPAAPSLSTQCADAWLKTNASIDSKKKEVRDNFPEFVVAHLVARIVKGFTDQLANAGKVPLSTSIAYQLDQVLYDYGVSRRFWLKQTLTHSGDLMFVFDYRHTSAETQLLSAIFNKQFLADHLIPKCKAAIATSNALEGFTVSYSATDTTITVDCLSQIKKIEEAAKVAAEAKARAEEAAKVAAEAKKKADDASKVIIDQGKTAEVVADKV